MLEINTKGYYIDKIWYLKFVLIQNLMGIIRVGTIVMESSQVKYNPGDLSNILSQ